MSSGPRSRHHHVAVGRRADAVAISGEQDLVRGCEVLAALHEAIQSLQRYEEERNELALSSGARTFVEEVRHVLNGGLSHEQRRTQFETAKSALAKLAADARLTMRAHAGADGDDARSEHARTERQS